MTIGSGLAIGIAASIAAALMLSAGSIIQALDVRRIDDRKGLRFSFLGSLVRRKRWLLGTLIGYLAFPFELVALANAPLVIVQPLHVTGLLLLLVAGVRLLREHLRRIDVAGTLLITVGVVLVAWGAPGGRDRAVSFAALLATVGGLVLVAAIPYAMRDRCAKLPVILSAALGYAGTNMAIKGFTDRLIAHDFPLAGVYLVAAAAGSIIAVLSQMTAFQRYRAVEVVPFTFAIPTFLPVVLGLFVLREDWARAVLGGLVFAVGAVLLVIGSTVVARSDPVTRVSRRASGDLPPA